MKTLFYKHHSFSFAAFLGAVFLIFSGPFLASAQVSVTATNGLPGPTVYTDLSSAFAAIDSGTHQGDIIIDITASFTDPAISVLNSTGYRSALYSSVLVRPAVDGVIVSYTSAQGRGMIELNGADNITLDGDNPNTAGINRNLSFTNTATGTTTYTSVIRIATGAASPFTDANTIVVKNLNINGSAVARNATGLTSTTGSENTTFGIVAGPNGGATVAALASVSTGMAAGTTVNSLSVQNCAINQCARAIAFLGADTTSSTGISIQNNLIGNQSATLSGALPYTTPTTTVYTKGIFIQGTKAVTISGNTIKNMVSYVLTPMSAIELSANIGTGVISITGNSINGVVQNSSTANGERGIYIASSFGSYSISGNTIQNIQGNNPSSTQQPAGIQVVTAAPSGLIEKNKIAKVYNWNNQSYGVNGIIMTGGSNITVQNNWVSDICQDMSTTGNFGPTYSIYGIKISSGNGHKIYHNTVHLFGTTLGAGVATSTGTFAFCITANTLTGIDVRNNIFSNIITGGASVTVAHAAIYLPSAGTSSMNLSLNNNAYFCGAVDSICGIAQVGGTAGTGLYKQVSFNAASTVPSSNIRSYTRLLNSAGTNDNASIGLKTAAPFVSNTDLHIPAGTTTPLESTGASVGVTSDIDGDTRPGPSGSTFGGGLIADIGSDEGDFTPIPMVIDSSGVEQVIASVLPGAANTAILKIKIAVSGYVNNRVLTSLKLNTTGSTAVGDIDSARIFFTGSGTTFSTTNQFGPSKGSLNGTFYITGSQALNKGDNYFWLVYDVKSNAGLLHVLDATLDSLGISGVNYAPANGNPAGNVTITSPMTFISSTTTQASVSKVGQGSVRNQIIGIQVVTSATGTPISATGFDFNTGSTTDTSAIRNIKVWYTGNSATFATTTRFGDSLITLPGTTSFTMPGSQALTNGTNYFWLTYDINASAPVGTSVDAECTSLMVDGAPRTPSVTAPSGSRTIRLEYCPPTFAFSCSNGDYVNNFSTTGALTNVSYLSSGCNNPSNSYQYNTSQIIQAYKSSVVTFHYQGSGTYPEGFKIWIDYNQDGVFDATEQVAAAAASQVMNHSAVTISCNALSGITRLRIRDVWNAQPGTACSNEQYGESEDYDIEILDNPVHFNYTTAIQQTGLLAAGNTDKPILRIPVSASGCGDAVTTIMRFNTAATTTPISSLSQAKLYSTGTSPLFSTNNLLGTIFSPNGSLFFLLNDTLKQNDTTNYWLVYDINPGATAGQIIDARFDSLQVLGSYYTPVNGNPSGNITVSLPMTYTSSTAIQSNTLKVAQGSVNNDILKVKIQTSATGAPVDLTQLDFNVNGTTDTSNISNLRVWYTGSVDSFSTTTPFGSVIPHLPLSLSFSITGTQSLLNGANYFWLTYDISPTAALGNAVDAEYSSGIINGVTQTSTVSAPVGQRLIRSQYCVPTQTGTALIKNVLLNSLHNTAVTPAAPFYRIFSADSTTTTLSKSQTYNLSVTTTTSAIVSVWIDYNDDGLFTSTEWKQVAANSPANIASVIPLTIPCSSNTGPVRMRIRSRTAAQANAGGDACTTFAGGETQDYTINIVNMPVVYESSTAKQVTGNIAPATNDNPVLQIPISSKGCGDAVLTTLKLNTAGTTNTTNIVSAKLYTTGISKVFNTSKQVGSSVFSPNGSFSFVVSDTLLNNDTTNYWLVYDVNSAATNGNLLDARLDSIEVNGTYRTPTTGAPAGSLVVSAPMTYLSSVITQSPTAFLGQGTANNHILSIRVATSATGSAVNLTQFDFSSFGTTSLTNIKNIKVWYTGSDSLFSTTTQLGSTLASLSSSSFSIIGNQPIINGNNYFWLSYDIDSFATIGNDVDAECLTLYIDGAPLIPTTNITSGTLKIRANYCVPDYSTGCADGDFVNNFTTVGGITNISNLASGCNPNPDSYIYYPSKVLTVKQGAQITINYRGSGDWAEGHKIWIDYNQDGIFSTSEMVASSVPTLAASTATIMIPLNAQKGTTRMRIRNVWNAQPSDACSTEAYGETEDYSVTILQAPAPAFYTWNKTSTDSFYLAANWTPSRTSPNLNDVLSFSSGGAVSVIMSVNPAIGSLVLTNNTVVTFNAPVASTITVADSLRLVSGKIITGANISLELGKDTINIGVLTGTGSVEGRFTRWVNAANTSYTLPLMIAGKNRSITINFTSAPAQSGTLSASFVTGPTTTGGLPLTEGSITVKKIATTGYWVMEEGKGLSGGVYDATFTAEGFTGITSVSGLVLAKRVNSTLPWTLQGTHITTTGTTTLPVLSRSGMTGFNEFGVGGDSLVQPLPVNLLFLAATPSDEGAVLLSWETASEINNLGFDLERSYDGKRFKRLAFMESQGNSNDVQIYEYLDKDAWEQHAGFVYYRLKQIDFNGEGTYSQIVTVSDKQKQQQTMICFPNPVAESFEINLTQEHAGSGQVEITDLSGRQVYASTVSLIQGINRLSITDSANWKNGVYFIRVVANEDVSMIKIIKAR
jgi:hypothetical protein